MLVGLPLKAKLALLILLSLSIVDSFIIIFPNFFEIRAAIKASIIAPLFILEFSSIIHKYWLILSFAVIAALGCLFFYSDSYNSVYSGRLVGFLAVFLTIYTALKDSKISALVVSNFFKVILLVITFSNFLAITLGRNLVYDDSGFSGTSGGYEAGNEYSYLLIIISSVISLEIIFKKYKIKISDFIYLFFILLNCFLLSTKSALIFSIANFFIILVFRRKIFLILLFIFFIIFIYAYTDIENINSISRFIFFMDRYDFIWAFTSGRSERLDFLSFDLYSLIPNINKSINFEMEALDALVNLGFLGFLVYLYINIWALRLSRGNIVSLVYISIIILISLLSGHLLNSIAVAPYLAALLHVISRDGNYSHR